MTKPKTCPFCGSKARVRFKQNLYYGQNDFGNKKMNYHVYVTCNKCFARGPQVTTDFMIDPNPIAKPHEFEEYVEKATKAWNRRLTDFKEGMKL